MIGLERARLAEELVWRLAAALRGAQLYATSHPLVLRNVAALHDTLLVVHATVPSIAIGIVGADLVVGDSPVPRAAGTMGDLMRRLQQAGVERIVVDRGVERGELVELVQAVARLAGGDTGAAVPRWAHVRVGRLESDRDAAAPGDAGTFRELYDEAVSVARRLWDSAATEGQPDADAARLMVDSLAQAVAQNRTTLMALTALKDYDTYTFTHMVNVSILTMGQARGLGIDGALLREIGLAALMHDIGKVRTPVEILNKPEALTPGEYDILKQHTVDGAEILRHTPEIPALVPIVALEHHLRADGTGYPAITRPHLNVATTLCGIADVYDAMRSARVYQPAFATDRILAVLKRNDGRQFDQHLVRRFVQLVGIYPAGTAVRLDSGAIAVVVKPNAADPARPRVRVVIDGEGVCLTRPRELDLWAQEEPAARTIEAPVDPEAHGIDPLIYL